MTDATIYPAQDFPVSRPRKVGVFSPLRWLQAGWVGMTRSLRASLAHGLLITAMGWVVVMFTSNHLYLFTAAVSGFLLLSPLMASGLYELSRRQELGESVTFDASLAGLKANRGTLTRFATVLVAVFLVWIVLSSLIFGNFIGGDVPVISGAIYQTTWLSASTGFLLAYGTVGGIVAVMVFAASAVSIPLLMDRGIDAIKAMQISVRTVLLNIPAMLLWATCLVILSSVGFATQLWGMIVIVPWLGHATWHAYRDTVG